MMLGKKRGGKEYDEHSVEVEKRRKEAGGELRAVTITMTTTSDHPCPYIHSSLTRKTRFQLQFQSFLQWGESFLQAFFHPQTTYYYLESPGLWLGNNRLGSSTTINIIRPRSHLRSPSRAALS